MCPFVLSEERTEQINAETYNQSQYVNSRIEFVFEYMAPGNKEVVIQHSAKYQPKFPTEIPPDYRRLDVFQA